MANQTSKYTFDEVELRLDTIKFDQTSSKVLSGDGTYVDISTAISSDVLQEAVNNIVQDSIQESVEKAVDDALSGNTTEDNNAEIDSWF